MLPCYRRLDRLELWEKVDESKSPQLIDPIKDGIESIVVDRACVGSGL